MGGSGGEESIAEDGSCASRSTAEEGSLLSSPVIAASVVVPKPVGNELERGIDLRL